MKKNMGNTDRLLRLSLALVIVLLYYTDRISGTLAIVLGILAVVFAVTSTIRFCPLYLPFGWNTRSQNERG